MPIRVLSEVVAAQIAAGEVIERPASVVKELIENALDAGARRIEVEVTGSGIERVRVVDDGHGIPADETALAIVRHATSKLQTVDDLNHIQTLGFRGEALASIASVARLTLVTRHESESAGARVVVEGGRVVAQEGIGTPIGTSVEVANLFYNVPARRKFLKSDTTEQRHITNLITRYAMAYPHVRFALYEDGKEQFRTSGNGALADVIVETLGLEVFRDMIEVKPMPSRRADVSYIHVVGYTTNAKQTRSNRSQIILFVNGRSIQDQRLTYAVVQAYHTIIHEGRYPIAVLMIELPPEEVDVNVHPTKAEVRFRSPDAAFGAVQRTVREALLANVEIKDMSAAQYAVRITDEPARPLADWKWQPTPNSQSFPRPLDSRQLDMDLDTPDVGRRSNQQPPTPDDDFLRYIPDDNQPIARPRSLPPLRVVGQVGATYIIAEGPVGVYLIDQHAAHERILYEKFMARYESGEKFLQHTLATAVVQLPLEMARFLEENLPILQELGFDIEPFGAQTFRVRAVPSMLADHDPSDLLQRMLANIEDGDAPAARDIEEKLVRQVCKTAAIKAGQNLSYDEMLGILRQLERCQHPLTCPHGRPTMIHLSNSDLAREFGRT